MDKFYKDFFPDFHKGFIFYSSTGLSKRKFSFDGVSSSRKELENLRESSTAKL